MNKTPKENINLSKRRLFTRFADRQPAADVVAEIRVRPPYALATAEFVQSCIGCDDCRTACPAQLIELDATGLPQLQFAQDGCDFCGDCVNACQHNALSNSAVNWTHKVQINERCLMQRGVICHSCLDICETTAIRSDLRTSNAPPLINLSACTGCGFCLSTCPTDAIELMQAA